MTKQDVERCLARKKKIIENVFSTGSLDALLFWGGEQWRITLLSAFSVFDLGKYQIFAAVTEMDYINQIFSYFFQTCDI